MFHSPCATLPCPESGLRCGGRARRRAGLVLATLLLGSTLSASPDVISPPPTGWKKVGVSCRVGLLEPDGAWIVGRTIAEGDTFRGLAQRELGDAALGDWVASLNSRVDPRRLRIDTLMWMPRKGAVGNDRAALVYVDHSWRGSLSARPFTPGEDGRDHASALILVRPEHQEDFEQCLHAPPGDAYRALEQAGHVARVVVPGIPKDLVPSDSDVASIEVDAVLGRAPDGLPQLEVTEIRYLDQEGEPVAAPPDDPGDAGGDSSTPEELRWWLALPAAGAALVLAVLAVRRARAARPA